MKRVGLWLVAVALAAGFAALGQWQWWRGAQKAAMIAAQERALADRTARPLSLLSRDDTLELA